MDDKTRVLQSKKLEFHQGQMQYAYFHETRASKVWDIYDIFMELKISFRYKQIWDIQSNVLFANISKVFTMH